jgi:hypothetical protein
VHEETQEGLRRPRQELIACCCEPKGSWPGGSEEVKATSENGCLRGESHCHVWSAWRGAKVVGEFRSVKARSEEREVRLDAGRERSEEKASCLSWQSVEMIAPERGLVREPLWETD